MARGLKHQFDDCNTGRVRSGQKENVTKLEINHDSDPFSSLPCLDP
jgi:hypothetical protein